jgi:hypothetical protein
MPEAKVDVRSARAEVEKPRGRPRKSRRAETPTDARYDPYDRYYPDPFGGLFSTFMWGALVSMHMPPDVVIVDDTGEALGHAGDAVDDMPDDDGPDDTGNDGDDGDDAGGDDDSDGGDFGD